MPKSRKSKPTKLKAASEAKMGWGYDWGDLRVQLNRIEAKLSAINTQVGSLLPVVQQEKRIMATLQDVLASVQAEKTDIDSIIALVGGLKQQVADALANAGVSPEIQAQIDSVFSAVETNKTAVHEAVTANRAPEQPAA